MSGELRLLVIDDSVDDFDLAACVLRRAGYTGPRQRVETAADLAAALAERAWDLCLLDWVLPQLTTPETMRLIAESEQPSLPAIVWSGKDDAKVRMIATEVLRARAFLSKADYAQLPSIVATVLAAGRS